MRARSSRWLMAALLAVALLYGAAAQARLFTVGPVDPVTGFPKWYMDQNGVALQLCLPPGGLCLTAPVDAANAHSVAIGFGEEAFYYDLSATAGQPNGPGASAELIVALEAAFGLGPPAPGDEMIFVRQRINADRLPRLSGYTVTHPYGTIRIPASAVEPDPQTPGRFAIKNFTIDAPVGLPANRFLPPVRGVIGPFVPQARPNVRGFIGTPLQPRRLAQLPPPPNGASFTLQGTGANSAFRLSTNVFTVQGQLARNVGVISRTATYSRRAGGAGSITVSATSAANQRLLAQRIRPNGVAGPETALTPTPPTSYTLTQSFARTLDPRSLTIRVRNASDADPLDPGPVDVTPRDVVTISSATFLRGVLTVNATSSDKITNPALRPTLTVVVNGSPVGDLVNGTLTVRTPIKPARVTVQSSNGGRAARAVQ